MKSAPASIAHVQGIRHEVGIFGIVLATLAAIALLPVDYYEPGQLRLSVIILAAGLLSGPLLSSLTDIKVWIRAESVLMLGLIYWLLIEPMGAEFTAYNLTRAGLIKAFSLIGLFASLVLVGSKLAHIWHGTFSKVSNPAEDFSTDWLYSGLLMASCLGLLARLIPCEFSPACIVEGLFSERGQAAWAPGVGGGRSAFVGHLTYFGYLSLPLTVALHHRIGRIDFRVAVGIILALLFFLFLMKDGGRRLAGMVMGSGMLTWLLLQPRMSFKQVFVGALLALLTLTILEMMFVFRTQEGGLIGGLFTGRAFDVASPLSSGLRVDNNFHYFVKTLDLIPEFRDHVGWSGVLYWLARPIPRVLWPGKPTSPGISLPWEFDEYWSDGFTITISAIGDWYLSYGVISVCLAALGMGFLSGKLVLAWLGPSVRQKLLYSLGLMCLFIGLRNYLELILMSYPILALYLLGKLTARRGKKTRVLPSLTRPVT